MENKMNGNEIEAYVVSLENIVNSIDNQSSDASACDSGNAVDIVGMLVKALADEWLAGYQYWVCKNLARGVGRTDAIAEFDQHAKDEFGHADELMLRIKELGGAPVSDPSDWKSIANPWIPVTSTSVCEQLDITIKAESDAIEYYCSIIKACAECGDEVTKKLCRSIMSDECEHLYDLQMLKEEICG